MSGPGFIAAAGAGPLLLSGGYAAALSTARAPCPELLNITAPRSVRAAHDRYLAAGARVIRTNTGAASPESLDRYRMHDESFIVSYMAAEHAAKSAAAASAATGIRRWALGVARIETRQPGSGFLTLDRVEAAAHTMASGLAGGGVDAVLLETSQDLARLTAAVAGTRRGVADAGRTLPLLLTLRYDPMIAAPQRDRIGPELAAAAAAAAGLGIAALSIVPVNLADRPAETLRRVSRAFPGPLFADRGFSVATVSDLLDEPDLVARLGLVGGGSGPDDTAAIEGLLRQERAAPPFEPLPAAANRAAPAATRRPGGVR